MKGNGNFGKWITDIDDLPAYDYTCDQNKNPIAKTPTTYGTSVDHFHQIGNDRITATAHNGGYIQVLDSSRGFQWLTYHNEKKSKFGGGICLFQIKNKVHSNLYNKNGTRERIFGMGYFRKNHLIDDLRINHIICAPFSDDPVFISEIIVENSSKTEIVENMKIVDFWDIYLHHILSSLVVTSNNRKKFGKSKILNGAGRLIKFLQTAFLKDTDGKRDKFDKKFTFDVTIEREKNLIILTPKYYKAPPIDKDKPAKHNYYPKSIFISMLSGESLKAFYEQEKLYNKKFQRFEFNWEDSDFPETKRSFKNISNPCLGIGTEILELKPTESKRIVCIFGYSEVENIDILIDKYQEITKHNSILKWNSNRRKTSIIELKCDTEPWLSRETMWHSYYVRSACYFDEYFNQHKFPQGSIYQFGHGFDGAIRDFVLYLYPVILLDVNLAKEYLSFILSLMKPDGKLSYALYGFGNNFSAIVHSKPSDLYLFLIWGILQYIYTTRDFEFLNQKITFYPKSLKKSSTVLERIYLALHYLFSEQVGLGKHGLIKFKTGDWSDGIKTMVKNRKKFIKYAESNFNSTFALYLLPILIPLLDKYNPELAELCRNQVESLKKAVLNTWNGKWFYRGWDGLNNPIGDKSIYLEHHTWLLISEILDKDQATLLIKNIYEILDNPSPIGQYLSYPPVKTKLNILPKGWDVNGGIWHAMNALLTWGYSKYDTDKAFNSLKKNSLANRAEVYPNMWYGIWSGPDAYIADYAENPGEAFYHLPTPMCDFPIMNLNIHACYLLSVIKILGIDADYDSISIFPKIEDQFFSFNSPLISIKSKINKFSVKLNLKFSKGLVLKIQKPRWWSEKSIVFFNNEDISRISESIMINENEIIIKMKENLEKIKIKLMYE